MFRAGVIGWVLVSVGLAIAASGNEDIRIQGSRTAARALRDAVSHGFSGRYGDISLAWDEAGSGAAFAALFAGDADIGLSSRSVDEYELRLAEKLGVELRETVLALDGIAVIVHRGNDVPSFSLEQLEELYSARIVRWLGFGGIDEVVRLSSPAASSGIQVTFRERVFGNRTTSFAPGTEYLLTPEELVARVASDRRSVGFVSMTVDRSSVRTVPIVASSGGAILPSPSTVESGDYPLGYPLRLYTVTEPEGRLRLFLTFLFLHDGPRLVADAGLVPLPAFTAMSRNVPSEPNRLPAPQRPDVTLVRVSFGFRGSRLDAAARRELSGVALRVAASGESVWITGHEEPGEGGRDLSDARARSVADFLMQQNVDRSRLVVQGRGAAEPVTSNAEIAGRRLNRRADVWIVAH